MKMGEGTGGDVLPYLLCSLPSTAAHTCPHVCLCVRTGLQHMHDRHVTSSRGLHFKSFTKPVLEAKQRALWE